MCAADREQDGCSRSEDGRSANLDHVQPNIEAKPLDMQKQRVVAVSERECLFREANGRRGIELIARVVRHSGAQGVPADWLRHASAMRSLGSHHCIVSLVDVVSGPSHLLLVAEAFPTDLRAHLAASPQPLPLPTVKAYMWQLLAALHHAHVRGVRHGSLAPEQVLVEPGTARLQVAGFASPPGSLTCSGAPESATLRYAAPEGLMQRVSGAVTGWRGGGRGGCAGSAGDLWSAGCVLAELAGTGGSVFTGDCEVEVLQSVHAAFGTAAGAAKCRARLDAAAAHLGLAGANLLARLLHPEPAMRITAADALCHPFLADGPACAASSA